MGAVSKPEQAAIASGCRRILRRGLHSYAPALQGTFAHQAISIAYPDRSPAKVAFVAPVSWPAGQPQIRLKAGDLSSDGHPRPALLAHELAHASHFSLMPGGTRLKVAARYASWLAARVATGGDPSHAADRRTSPMVAWLEAFGLFAERFDIFARYFGAGRSGPALHSAFLAEELAGGPRMTTVVSGYRTVAAWAGEHNPLGSSDPSVEGSVYSGVFLHRGSQRGLTRAVEDYLASARVGVLTLRQFGRFVGS
jgi:hypothetical protein